MVCPDNNQYMRDFYGISYCILAKPNCEYQGVKKVVISNKVNRNHTRIERYFSCTYESELENKLNAKAKTR